MYLIPTIAIYIVVLAVCVMFDMYHEDWVFTKILLSLTAIVMVVMGIGFLLGIGAYLAFVMIG